MKLNTIYFEECLQGMGKIPSGSIDMILCDLPYGTTHNRWDAIIPFAPLWQQYERVAKVNAAIVLTGQSAFSAKLIISNEKTYRYSLIWEKTKAGGFLNAAKMPLQAHEDILIFYKKLPVYNPQYECGKPYAKKAVSNGDGGNYGKFERSGQTKINEGVRFPKSIISIANPNNSSLHPTQKPVALFEYLIKTYTNEGDTVLDNCMGSGTTAIACLNTNRFYIGFENNEKYYQLATERIRKHAEKLLDEI